MIWKTLGRAVACAALLAACSGGGGNGEGSGANSFTDGLGLSGQAPGTFVVTATNVPLTKSFIPAVTLDEQGRGLVVWFDSSPFRPLMWQRGDANQRWSALSEIGPGLAAFTLRGNAAGDAVLGFSSAVDPPRVLRHAPATGWAAAPLDVPLSSARPHSTTFPQKSNAYPLMDKGSDLALMTDGSIVLSRAAPATVPSGQKTFSFRVFRHRAVAGWETLHETPPLLYLPSFDQLFYLATNLDGTAMFFWVHTEPPQSTGGPIHTLNLQSLNVLTGTALGAFAFAQGEYEPCAITAANSPSRFKVLAVMHRPGPNGPCAYLDLIRISADVSGTTIHRDRISPGALVSEPMIAMNQQGDAIAIWLQATPADPLRVVWSQSLLGGPWSAPQPVLPESAGMGEIAASTVGTIVYNMVSFGVNTAFAANANGQVVGVLQTNKDGREYLVTGRFSFATGWSWQLAANMMGTTNGGVSAGVGIDSAGTGLLIYYATPCERTQAQPGFALPSCGSQGTFGLKF